MLLLAGVIVGLVGGQVGPLAPSARSMPVLADARIAQRFYTAIDATLTTGDASQIDAAITPDYADHALPGVSPDGAGLARAALALRAVYPDVRLSVTELSAGSDRIFARLALSGSAAATVGSIAAPLARSWPQVEILRVAKGRVAERWAQPTGTALLEPIGAAPVDAAPQARQQVTVWKHALQPGETSPVIDGPGSILIDDGPVTVAVSTDSTSPVAAQPATGDTQTRATTLQPGDRLEVATGTILSLPASTHVALANASDAERSALELTIAPIRAVGVGTTSPTDPSVPPVVTGGLPIQLSTGSETARRVSVCAVTIGPGDALATHVVQGAEAVVVQSGELVLQVPSGVAWWRDGTGINHYDSPRNVAAGSGYVAEDGALIEVRNASAAPVTAIVFTIETASG